MMKWLILLVLMSCQEWVEKGKKIIPFLAKDEKKETSVSDYRPPVAPTYEQDVVIKVDPRQKFISLLDAFIKEPDLQMKEIVVAEFKKFVPGLSDKLDPELGSLLEKIKNEFSRQNILHLLLMYQLSLELKGENKNHAQSLLALGFDQSPYMLFEMMAKKSNDTICDLVVKTREEDVESKKLVLKTRYATILSFSSQVKDDVVLKNYHELCLNRLKSEYQVLGNQVSNPDLVEEVDSTTP